VWEPKRDKTFGDDSIKFLIDLRNFSMHYATPPVRVGTTMRWSRSALNACAETLSRLNHLSLQRRPFRSPRRGLA
jgi:hypothetical protein